MLLKCLRIGPASSATGLRSLCEGCCRLVNKLQESVLQESVPPMGLFVITKLSKCSIKQSRALCRLPFAQSQPLSQSRLKSLEISILYFLQNIL